MSEQRTPAKRKRRVERRLVFLVWEAAGRLAPDAERDGGWSADVWLDRAKIELGAAGVDVGKLPDRVLLSVLKDRGVRFAKAAKGRRAYNRQSPRLRRLARQVGYLAEQVRGLCDALGHPQHPRVSGAVIRALAEGVRVPGADDPAEGGGAPC